MDKILLLYGSSEGQTAKIAHRIADAIHTVDLSIHVINAQVLPDPFPLDDYAAVIVGASIHMGAYPKYIRDFAQQHHEELRRMPSAFFSVCLTAASDQPEAQAEARGYLDHFMQATGWHPDMVANFAGALAYSHYGLLKRLMVQSVARRIHEPTDTSHDYELTDWGEVGNFAAAFLKLVGVAQPAPLHISG